MNLNIELVLSIVAIIISLAAIAFEFFGNQRINRVNLRSTYYVEIYNNFLVTKIPEARNKLIYNNNRISNTDELIDVLNDMRRKSLFFKYQDEKFYKKICDLLQSLEDKLVTDGDESLDSDEYCSFTKEVKESIDKIYKMIFDRYTGRLFS